jgi:uncharacterized caspase-like protein
MRLRFDWCHWLGLLAVAAGLLFAGAAAAQTRIALVIGNGAYRHVPVLPNPGNDAGDVAASLERLGFSVRRVTDGTFEDMRRALIDFGQRARAAEIAVVFFAGHGMEIGGENWLIPVDAELKTDLAADHEAVALKSIMPMLAAASKLGLVILDACRNNPFAAKMQRTVRTRAVSRGLTHIEPTGSVLVAYAAKDGTTAADGTGRNSPFTAALLSHVETPGLEINFLFRNVRDDVLRATQREQEPFVYGSLSRDAIYLKPPAPAAVAAAPAAPAADAVMWEFIKDTNDATALKRFVDQFPASARRAEAERRISALAVEAAKAAAAARGDPREIARSLQLELRRVGCFDGAIDGEFSAATRAALRNFVKLAALRLPDDPSLDAVKAVRSFDKRVCPLVCQAGERADGERCVRIGCPSGQVLKDGACVAERASSPARPAAAPKGAGAAKCFTFQGRQYCE